MSLVRLLQVQPAVDNHFVYDTLILEFDRTPISVRQDTPSSTWGSQVNFIVRSHGVSLLQHLA
jgi:hypothetical protein